MSLSTIDPVGMVVKVTISEYPWERLGVPQANAFRGRSAGSGESLKGLSAHAHSTQPGIGVQ